jgi:glycosyltransferase involved in cell wall biosynthesis
MLTVFFNNRKIRDSFDLSFSYGYNPAYEAGLKEKIKIETKTYPLHNTSVSWNASGPGILRYITGIFIKMVQYLYFFKNILSVYHVIKKVNPDIVHINNGGYPGAYSCSAAVFAAKMAGKDKIIYIVNNIAIPRSNWFRKPDFWIDGYVARNTSGFVTGSSYAGESLKSVLKLRDDQHVRIPNTIMARSNDESREETRKRLGLKNDDIVIGNVALFEERKGQRYLIEAFYELTNDMGTVHNLKLVFEGRGTTKHELTELAATYGLNDKVLFVEEKNIYNLYNCLDIFVLPSITYEDFPNVIIEIMSLGKPVIGSRVGGIPEQIEDGRNGFIVTPGNVEQLKDALKRIVSDKNLIEKMGSESRRIYESNYQEDIVMDRYINLYETVLKSQR